MVNVEKSKTMTYQSGGGGGSQGYHRKCSVIVALERGAYIGRVYGVASHVQNFGWS